MRRIYLANVVGDRLFSHAVRIEARAAGYL
jgi:hypothetical protein